MRLSLQRGFLFVAVFWLIAVAGSVVAEAAERVASTKGSLFEEPLFAGGRIIWGESRCLRPCEDGNFVEEQAIRLARTDARPVTLFRDRRGVFESGPNGSFSSLSFTASKGHLAVLKSATAEDEFSSSTEDILSAGRLGRPLRRVFRCEGGSSRNTAFALTGDTLIYIPGPCSRRAAMGFVALDLGDGTREAITQPRLGKPAELKAQGRFASYELVVQGYARQYVVYDRAAGREVYSVSLPEERDIIASDLQRDGKIVLLTRTIAESAKGECRGYKLSWYSPAEPTAHDLALTPCSGNAAIAGDRIVFASADPRPGSLTVTDLSGHTRQLADFGYFSDLDTLADRVTYSLRNCAGGSDLFIQPFDEPSHSAPSTACPVRIASRRLRATPRHRVRVRLRCPSGCNGRVSLRGLDGRKLALQDFALTPADTKQVTLKLNRRGRVRLRRAGQLRLTIKALTVNTDFGIRRASKPAILR